MPGASGQDLAAALHDLRPATKVLYMSGYTGRAIASGVKDTGLNLIEKPFASEQLLRKMREVLDAG